MLEGERGGVPLFVLSRVEGHVGEGDFDAIFIEFDFHAAVEFAADAPLLDGFGFDAGFDDDG